ncbi:radical SAM protein [Paenibacillus polymyxa]|uniref:7-carboxy-7-deazaguanine synthase QueE n=1 Tax=Paenibacillus polymyxa TaxID=1406 RepID=UPI001BEC331D|nr:radical SAM protein [Paenibacillus polymyxa]MBT2282956.1 radical SAM protein [Paenibacillus polymyxa]
MLTNNRTEYDLTKIPMVEIFETIEGEGMAAGLPTTFIRLYNCNLRCSWCDTKYSYAPAKPEFTATISDIIEQVNKFGNHNICLTGGEPLLDKNKSSLLIQALSDLSFVKEIHIETNGAIDLMPFINIRKSNSQISEKVRFVLDYKLPNSGEMGKMNLNNLGVLKDSDELKFVIGSEEDFLVALDVLNKYHKSGIVLMSPVWETMAPARLASLILQHKLLDVKLNIQLHKIIWDPDARGV